MDFIVRHQNLRTENAERGRNGCSGRNAESAAEACADINAVFAVILNLKAVNGDVGIAGVFDVDHLIECKPLRGGFKEFCGGFFAHLIFINKRFFESVGIHGVGFDDSCALNKILFYCRNLFARAWIAGSKEKISADPCRRNNGSDDNCNNNFLLHSFCPPIKVMEKFRIHYDRFLY